MPRNGSGVYSHPFPDVVEGTTIESAVFNGNTSDVEQDLNTPRPIVAGGTGASDAHQALINLHGEEALQLVANYDSFPFVNGSFYSQANATGAPNSTDPFYGIYYSHANNSYAVIEARDLSGNLYVRRKVGGVWGAWTPAISSTADMDTRYVNAPGDVMTGNLAINKATNPALGVHNGGAGACMYLKADGSLVFATAYSDGSPAADMALINGGVLSVNGGINAGALAATGTYYFGNSGSKYLGYDGTNYNFAGAANVNNVIVPSLYSSGNISLNGAVSLGNNSPYGTLYFGNTGTKSLSYDGTNYFFNGGSLYSYSNSITVGYGGTTGGIYFGNTGVKNITYDGSSFYISGGAVLFSNALYTKSVVLNGPLGDIYNLDATFNTVAVANTAIVTILLNFSGLIILSNWTNGVTEMFICGNGVAVRVSGSSPTTVSVGYAPPQNGYVIYNQSGGTATYGVMALRTRSAG